MTVRQGSAVELLIVPLVHYGHNLQAFQQGALKARYLLQGVLVLIHDSCVVSRRIEEHSDVWVIYSEVGLQSDDLGDLSTL